MESILDTLIVDRNYKFDRRICDAVIIMVIAN